jgi:hypothetical protein
MYRGKKFNSKKEDVEGPEGMYLGIRIFRFYMKCTRCNAEFSICTDPKNGDYTCETGVSRNFEIWKEEEAHDDKERKIQEEEEQGDAMRRLENRTEDSKREMDQLDALDEIKALNKRHEKVNTIAKLNALHDSIDEKAAEVSMQQDELKIKQVFSKASVEEPVDKIKRLLDNEEEGEERSSSLWNGGGDAAFASSSNNSMGVAVALKVKKKPAFKRKAEESLEKPKSAKKLHDADHSTSDAPVALLGGLVGIYSSDDD